MPTKTELLCKAKELGLRGYTGMNKARLEEFVNAATQPKKIRVKRPKVSTPPIDTSAIDEAKKYLEDLEQKKIVKGVAKLKGTIAKGKAENLLRKAMAKYKASKTEKAEKADKPKKAIIDFINKAIDNYDKIKLDKNGFDITPGSANANYYIKQIFDQTEGSGIKHPIIDKYILKEIIPITSTSLTPMKRLSAYIKVLQKMKKELEAKN